jgi:hypothetical protein
VQFEEVEVVGGEGGEDWKVRRGKEGGDDAKR